MTTPTAPSSQPVAIVTGGASGIGRAMSEHLAGQGYRVAVMDVQELKPPTGNDDDDGSGSGGGTITTYGGVDVASWDAQMAVFQAVYARHGRIDVVCANAGISESGASSVLTTADAAATGEPVKPELKTLDVNLTGTIYTVKLATHYLAKNTPNAETGSRGAILCTASNAGLYPFPVAPLYAASKGGVVALVRSMARPLEREGIQINALAPAVLETNIAPSKDFFKKMTVTPMTTLVRGVAQLLGDTSITGAVAEIHGDRVTLRPHLDYVDEDSRRNLENFWNLGYA